MQGPASLITAVNPRSNLLFDTKPAKTVTTLKERKAHRGKQVQTCDVYSILALAK